MSNFAHKAEALARSLAARERDADQIRARCGLTAPTPLSPLHLENCFPVACVAVPDLCIGAACRWALRGAGELPPCLQCLLDADSLEAGRPLRGACLAFRGKALLLADEKDGATEQVFSFLHEAAHFFLHHAFPRDEAIKRLGPGIREVLDGKRPPRTGERFEAAVRRADLNFHTHLYRRNAPSRSDAETDADALACLLMAPCDDTSTLTESDLRQQFGLSESIAAVYAAALILRQTPPTPSRRHPLLTRFGL